MFPVSLQRHARRRLDYWAIDLLQGRRVDRWINGIAAIKSLLPPRVLAVGIRTAFNGWTTRRRFQQTGRCVLNCGAGIDAIEHYAHCRVYHRLVFQLLHLPRPEPSMALASFLGLASEPPKQAALRALARYALYRTMNGSRHGAFRHADAGDAFRGHLRDATAGHPAAMRLVASAWASSSAASLP